MISDLTSKEHPKLQAALDMVDILRGCSDRIEEMRQLPVEVIDQLFDAGLLHLRKPARFGGSPVPLDIAYEVGRELARGDGSAAWVYGVYTAHEHLMGFFPEEVQAEYWSAPRALSASSYIPCGKVVAVDGGFRLSGQWPFCSGIDHATCAVIGGVAGMIEGEPPRPDVRLFLVKAEDYTIIDDWRVMGLQGTGSKSILLSDVFVPHSQVLSQASLLEGGAPETSLAADPAFGYPVWTLVGFSLLALATGVARHAYEDLVSQFIVRAERKDALFQSRRASLEVQLAKLSVTIDAAELVYRRALNDTFALVNAGLPLPEGMEIRNRRDLSYSVATAYEASGTILAIGGARNIREGGTIQRAHRDLCAMAAHPGASWDASAPNFGAFVLGARPRGTHWI